MSRTLYGSWIAKSSIRKSHSSILPTLNRECFQLDLNTTLETISNQPPFSCDETREQLLQAAANQTRTDAVVAAVLSELGDNIFTSTLD